MWSPGSWNPDVEPTGQPHGDFKKPQVVWPALISDEFTHSNLAWSVFLNTSRSAAGSKIEATFLSLDNEPRRLGGKDVVVFTAAIMAGRDIGSIIFELLWYWLIMICMLLLSKYIIDRRSTQHRHLTWLALKKVHAFQDRYISMWAACHF